MSAAPQLASKSIVEEQIIPTEPGSASGNEGIESSRPAEIARLAYALWQQRGCPVGSAEVDWLEAEQQLRRPGSSTQDKPLGRTAVSPL